MGDVIVYTTISNGGGVDGYDHTDKGGNVTGAFLDKKEAQKCNPGYNTVKPIVVDLEELAKEVLKKMDPVDRLAVDTYIRNQKPTHR
jgi:hypothetical protein